MFLNDIKNAAAAYHGKTAADFTVSGQDLFLFSANNAQKEAQLLHKFVYTQTKGVISIPGASGVDLTSATIEGSDLTTSAVTTPATAGTYVLIGFYRGFPLYMATISGNDRFIYYNPALAAYINAAMVQSASSGLGTYFVKSIAVQDPTGSYSAAGGASGAPSVASLNSRLTKWREISAVTRLRPDGTHQPIDFTRADIAIEKDRYELELSSDFWPENRYPSDADVLAGSSNSTVVQQGNSLFLHPRDVVSTQSLDVNLFGWGWLKEYSAADLSFSVPADFLVEHGHQWLLWSVIIDINYMWKTFVPRTEGNLGPPESAKATAWQKLLLWDSYLIDSNITRSR